MKRVHPVLLLLLFTNGLFAASLNGTVTYQKTIYSRPDSKSPEATVNKALSGAEVRVYVGASTFNTVTDASGHFHLDLPSTSLYSVDIFAQNSTFTVGSDIANGQLTDVYAMSFLNQSGNTAAFNINEDDLPGAFNIFNTIQDALSWLDDFEYELDYFEVQWPSSGTYFSPKDRSIHLLSSEEENGDPDEFDDDIILHELGHLIAASISVDHSIGGPHHFAKQYDLRLAWSEGLATYLSCAIRDDPYYTDYSGGGKNHLGVTNLGLDININEVSDLFKQSTNEIAVAHVLWKARSNSGDGTILKVLSDIKNKLPSHLATDPISMDTFYDLYDHREDLAKTLEERGMSYFQDNLDESTKPVVISEDQHFDHLTFFPSENSDWFSFTGSIGDEIRIETSEARNGALTFIRVFDNHPSGNQLAYNAQANGLSSDSTSLLDYELSSPSQVYIEIGRFKSQQENFGANDTNDLSYGQTVGRYGGYDVSFDVTEKKLNSTPEIEIVADANSQRVTGTVNFLKTYFTRPNSNEPQYQDYEKLCGVEIEAFVAGVSQGKTHSNQDGSFSLDIETQGSYDVIVRAKGTHASVGKILDGGTLSDLYDVTFTGLTGESPTLNISTPSKIGAFNIVNELEKAVNWIADYNYSLQPFNVEWPSDGTYFDTEDLSLHFQDENSSSGDPDEFDDDIILHEFGHLFAEVISVDHSGGGRHFFSGKYDLRLAWSEGLATYLSSAIRNDPYHADYSGMSVDPSGMTRFGFHLNIADIDYRYQESSNEIAVAHILWKARDLSGDAEILQLLSDFRDNLPEHLIDEQVSLDTFYDLYEKKEQLNTYYTERGMSYELDQLNSGTSVTDPFDIDENITLDGLTFFPNGASDWFRFTGIGGDQVSLSTSNTGNGAITFIKVYDQQNIGVAIAENNPSYGTSLTNTDSSLNYTLNQEQTLLLEVGRFNSDKQNYGLEHRIVDPYPYEKTVGRYGNYDLSINVTRFKSPISNHASSEAPTGSDQTEQATKGAGGGGCLLGAFN